MTPADEAGTGGSPGERHEPGGDDQALPGDPAGQVYDWFMRGRTLLEGGNPQAAAELLRHARSREPESASVLEVLARALFDAHRYDDATREFANLVEVSPDDDYARFGLGLSRWRGGDMVGAAEALALAVAMRPDRREYQQALRQVRATLRAQQEVTAGRGRGSPDDLPGPGGADDVPGPDGAE